MSRESLTLDGLSLADGVTYDLVEAPVFKPGEIKQDWIGGPDADGEIAVDEGNTGNSTLTLVMRVQQQATVDLGLAAVSTLVKQLEACRDAVDGLELVWLPKDATTPYTLYVLSAAITDVPMDSRGDASGWLVRSPRFTVALTCKPFLYGAWAGARINLVANPSFETNTTGWETSGVGVAFVAPGATFTRVADATGTGSFAGNIATDGSNTSGAFIRLMLDAGRAYTVRMKFKRTAGTTAATIAIGRNLSPFPETPLTTNGTDASFTEYTVQFTPVSSGEHILYCRQNPGTASTYRIDGVMVAESASSIAYFDGSTTGYVWTGATNNSISAGPNAVRSSTAVAELVVPSVGGHVPAEGLITLIEGSSQARRHLEVGMAAQDATAAVLIPRASLVTTGFSGIPATLTTIPIAIAGTGVLTHSGRWRVKLLGATSSGLVADHQLRLAYRSGDGEYSYTPWVAPPSASACEVDLGAISLRAAASGVQAWDGRLEGKSITGANSTFDLASGHLLMLPIQDGYIKARAPYVERAGTLIAKDFSAYIPTGGPTTQVGLLGTLNGHTAESGGNWLTSGSAADFSKEGTSYNDVNHWAYAKLNALVTDRFAILGGVAINTNVSFTIRLILGTITTIPGLFFSAIARYTDVNNYLFAEWDATYGLLKLTKRASGVDTVISTQFVGYVVLSDMVARLSLAVFDSGLAVAAITDDFGYVRGSCIVTDSALATGSALASGKVGFRDRATVTAPDTASRRYSIFTALSPPPDFPTLNSGRTVQLTHEAARRESLAGGTFGELATRGSRVFIRPAGDTGRSTRFVAKARRQDVDTTADSALTDTLTMAVAYRPRYRLPTG